MTSSDEAIPAWLTRIGVPGIVDLHVHFMPDRMQQKVWGFFDDVAATGAPPWPITYRLPQDERVDVLRALGVRAFTTLNYPHRPGMARWLNDYSTEFAATHADAVHSGTFFPEPGVTQVVSDALAAGVRVFKVHIQVGAFSPLDPQLGQAWRLIADAGVPVVIHCGNGPHPGEFTGIAPIRALVERYPDLVLIIAHAGLPEYAEFADLARRHPNVYLDTTMVGTDYVQQIAPLPSNWPDLLDGLRDKVVLGSDFPSIPYAYAHQLEALESWGMGDAWLADVLWHTPRRLAGLTD